MVLLTVFTFIFQIVAIPTLADMEIAGQSDHPTLVTASRDTLEQTVIKPPQVSPPCFSKSHPFIRTTMFLSLSLYFDTESCNN